MNEVATRYLARAGLLPALLYATALGLVSIRGLGPLAAIGVLVAAVPLAAVLLGRGRSLLMLAPVPLVGVAAVLALIASFDPTGPGMLLLGGLLIGVPLAFAAILLLIARGSALVMPLTILALVELFTLSASVGVLGSGGLGFAPGALVVAFWQSTAAQIAGFQSLLGGAASATLPLQALTNPWLALLGLLALVAALLEFVDPRGVAGPTPTDAGPTAVLGPVACAVIAAASFELLAAATPRYALLTLGGVVAGIVVLLLVLPGTRRHLHRTRSANSA